MNPLTPGSTIALGRAVLQAGRSARIGVAIAAAILGACTSRAADLAEGVIPIAELKGLAPQELIERPAFRIRGVVTWHADVRMVVQDETTAMFCYRKSSAGEAAPRDLPVERGLEVEVSGVGERGGFGPRLRVESVLVIGPGTLPEPRDVDIVRASEGAHDTELVRLTGVVLGSKQDGEDFSLLMETDGRGFTVKFNTPDQPCEPADLIDAVATVVGVAFPSYNTRGESMGLNLSSSMPDWFRLVEKPPAKPFESPRVGIDAIARYASLRRPGRIIQTEGTLIHAVPGEAIYLQDGRSGIPVKCDSAEPFVPGDRVAVAGFPDRSGPVVGLKNALVRKRGPGLPPAPLEIMPEAIEQANLEAWKSRTMLEGGDFIGGLVRFPATLVETRRTQDGGEMLLRAGKKIVAARVHVRDLMRLARLQPESELDVTGIVTAGWGRDPSEPPDRIGLLVRSAGDVVLVRPPSWWTPRRLLLALATVGAVLAGAVAWAVVLRRQVALQVARLAGEIEKRREAAIGFRAALAERNRLANNLHDTLLQGLAGAVLQIDSSRFALQGGRLDAAEGQIEKSKRMVQRAANDLRNSVWALRVAPLEGRSFGESLTVMADHLASGDTPRIVVQAADDPFEIPEFVTGNLLLVAQEAVRNAVHHAECASVDVRFECDAVKRMVTLTVQDDGRGFDRADAASTAQGHFGLLVMQERMEDMGGWLEIESLPGHGTTITASIELDDE
jgi:signal transduction histidine kinase